MNWFIRAYSRLSSTRTYGMAPNPISLSEIFVYIDRYPPPYDENFVVDLLLHIDSEMLQDEVKPDG